MSWLPDNAGKGTSPVALADQKTPVEGRQDSHSQHAIHPSRARGRRVDLRRKERFAAAPLVSQTASCSKSRAFACSHRCASASCADERRNSCLVRPRCQCGVGEEAPRCLILRVGPIQA